MKLLTIILLLISSTLAAQVDFTSSNLPIILIETDGQAIPDTMDINVVMKIIDNGAGNRNYITDSAIEYDIGIQTRGNSSQYYFPKKQYGIDTGNNISIFGMPPEHAWVLQAPYSDKTFMRNVLVYQLATDMGYWAPRTQYCEVILNGNYDGLYVFMERVTQSTSRINLEPPTDPDWGFLAEATHESHLKDDDIYFGTQYVDRFWVIKYPNAEDITTEKLNYITDKVTTFDTALYSSSLPDYQDQFDMASFCDVITLNGLTRNVDFFLSSTFINSNYGDVLHLGPVWDFNIAFGNCNYFNSWETAGWVMDIQLWAAPLVFNPTHNLQEHLSLNWSRQRNNTITASKIDALIDGYAELIQESQERDFQRWPRLGDYVWPNYFIGETWNEEVEWMRSWIHDRLAWLDTQWDAPTLVDPVINEINYNSSDSFDPKDWVELYNPSQEPIDISSWCFRDEKDTHSFYIPAQTIIPADDYLVLCKDVGDFSAYFPGVTAIGNLGFGLSGSGEIIRLFNNEGLLVDYVNYDDIAPWPTAPNGNGPTLELIAHDVDNNLPTNWSSFSDHGSPGVANGAFQPIFLTNFSVETIEGGALLLWSTYDSNTNFTLNGNNGVTQWSVPINETQYGNWSAIDQHQIEHNKTVTYQLFVIDDSGFEYLVGALEYSPNFIPTLKLKNISPNPAKNNVAVSFSAGKGQNTRISIYDLAGRLVKTVPVNLSSQVKTVNLDNLATGVYLISMENEYRRETKKLVINK
ncbi:T9SS type A sorting domain-containing protein [bacterium]|jgi:hypothetical protein|nr:T9SS type A sorting domain-containing protein [bacterium]